jgi:parallel beta-helix repeat protein
MKTFSARRLISLLSASALVATLAVAALPAAASAAAPPAPYFNGFENASDAVSPSNSGTQAMFDVTRVSSGDGGITSASGSSHALAAQNTGSLDQFTRLGGFSNSFPVGGYTTSVDVYLDMTVATGANDLRFDWSSAISDTSTSPDHRRDFIFSVGTANVPGQFVMSASNNSPGWPADPGRDPFTILTSGWYTFQHTFRDAGAGVLAVDMSVRNSSNTVLHTWTLSDPTDIIGTTVGGNRYGWLVTNGFPTLALDNITRSGIKCTPTGFIRDGINLTAAQVGGTVTDTLDATGCNIGAYNPSSVTNATIFGANYFGVVADGGTHTVTDSTIRNIGEVPFNGSQHGVGIYFTGASGAISGNSVSLYQKGGIVARDGGKVTINDNTVTGEGGISYIAQNGIQVSFGTSAKLFSNDVSLNNYTPSKVTACGLLIYKAGGVSGVSKAGIAYIKADNSFHNNETDICNFGKGGGFDL